MWRWGWRGDSSSRLNCREIEKGIEQGLRNEERKWGGSSGWWTDDDEERKEERERVDNQLIELTGWLALTDWTKAMIIELLKHAETHTHKHTQENLWEVDLNGLLMRHHWWQQRSSSWSSSTRLTFTQFSQSDRHWFTSFGNWVSLSLAVKSSVAPSSQ